MSTSSFRSFLFAISLTVVAGAGAHAQCTDPWLNQAFASIGRHPNGSGNNGECNVGRYGGASWGTYRDSYGTLLAWVKASWTCQDAWIGEVYATDIGRPVNGSGVSGECNTRLYGNGSWSSFNDLKNKVKAYVQQQASIRPTSAPTAAPPTAAPPVTHATTPPATTPPAAAPLDPASTRAGCQYMLGRDCDAGEIPTFPTRDAAQIYLLTKYIPSSAGVRDRIIQTAFNLTFGQQQLCTEGWTFARQSYASGVASPTAGHWSSFSQLYYNYAGQQPLIKTAASSCGAAAPTTGQPADPTVARTACQTMLGRDCQSSEQASLVRLPNQAAMDAYLRDNVVRNNPIPIIQAAHASVLGGNSQPCTEEVNDLRARFVSSSAPQAGSTWSGFRDLTYAATGQQPLVKIIASTRCVVATPTAGASSTIMTMISNAYQADFGRQASQAELNYWASQKANDPRLASAAAFTQNDREFLKSTPAERQAVIQRAYAATWAVNLAPNSNEMKYWDSRMASGQVLYNELKRANDLTKSANPGYVPGQPLKAPLKAPAQYGLLSADAGTMNELHSAFGFLNNFFTDIQKIGNEYMKGPAPPKVASTPPAPSPLPRMRTANPRGISGPFVIAATYHDNPGMSFCLDTGSWDPGSPVVAAPCHGGDSQLFNVDQYNRIYMTNNPNGMLCLDGGDKPWPLDPRHKQIVLNRCSDSKTQQWYVNTIPGLRDGTPFVNDFWARDLSYRSSGQIQNIGNGFCVDIEGGHTNQSNTVIAYDCIPLKRGQPRPWNQIWGAGHILSTGAAYIFLRYDPPGPAGHTGWGIQLADGSWEGGTFDGPETGTLPIFNISSPGMVEKGDNNYAWRHHFANEQELRSYFMNGKVADSDPYKVVPYDRYYKWQLTGTLNTAAALSLESQSWDWGYGVLGNNCLDVTYKVLRAYGWGLPAPAQGSDITQLAPKTWFMNVMNGAEPLWLHGQ